MAELKRPSHAEPVDGDEFRELRAAQGRAQALRNETITKERARVQAVAALLGISTEELLGLPRQKRRNTKPAQE